MSNHYLKLKNQKILKTYGNKLDYETFFDLNFKNIPKNDILLVLQTWDDYYTIIHIHSPYNLKFWKSVVYNTNNSYKFFTINPIHLKKDPNFYPCCNKMEKS